MALKSIVIGGGFLGDNPVVFSEDNKYILYTSGAKARVVSIATGEVVRYLLGHEHEITCMINNPRETSQIITGSLDRTIKFWDYNKNDCLKTIQLSNAVSWLGFIDGSSDYLYYATCQEKRSKKNVNKRVRHKSVLYRLRLSDGNTPALERVYIIKDVATFAGGRMVAAINGKDITFFGFAQKDVTAYTHTWSYQITAVSCHPAAPVVATGDTRGVITLWHSCDKDTAPVTSTFHWHAHSVSALQFNSDGSYLLSGGDEAVLVLWQIETGAKRFLPRLGAPLTSISISNDNALYGIGIRNNSVHVRDASTLGNIRTYSGVACAGDGDVKQHGGEHLVIEPRHNLVVLNTSSDGNLQFYDPWKDTCVYRQEVSRRNFLTRQDGRQIFPTELQHISFGLTGKWMATVEVQNNRILRDCRIKFWELTPQGGERYTLRTSVNSPHNTSNVTALAAHPSENIFVTCGEDAQFKVWSIIESTWQCLGVGSYKGKGCNAASFSADGSLMAISFDQIVTLWDSEGEECKGTLPHTPFNHETKIQSINFVEGTPLMVTHTATHLYVWNLLKCAVVWCMEMNVLFLAVAKTSPIFTVITDGGRIVSFNAESHIPIATEPLTCPGAPIAIGYFSDAARPEHLLIFDDHLSFSAVSLTSSNDELPEELQNTVVEDVNKKLAPLTSDMTRERKARQSLISNVLGSIEPMDTTGTLDVSAHRIEAVKSNSVKDTFGEIMAGPTHVLPSIDNLYKQVVSACLGKATSDNIESEDEDDQDKNDHMDVDSENDEESETVAKSQHTKEAEPIDFDFMVTMFESGELEGKVSA